MTFVDHYPAHALPESHDGKVDDLHDLEYPTHDFADVAERLGVLADPDVADHREWCLKSSFDDEIAYEQALLTVIHACDVANIEHMDHRTLVGLGFCMADIHYRTGRYDHCLHQLGLIKEMLGDPVPEDKPLQEYVNDAFDSLADQLYPVSTRIITK